MREAAVVIDGSVHGKIDQGFLLLVGIQDADDEATVRKMAEKISRLRVFEDEAGKMNLSLAQVGGAVLSISQESVGGSLLLISQFTLYADCHKGNRPSFDKAGKPDHARKMYAYFNDVMRELGHHVEEGIFAADMKVSLCNDGPVTIIMDSQELFG